MMNYWVKTLHLVGALLLGISTAVSQGHVLWLESEQFDDLGGWTIDGQFIDQMGSPYLLAIGYGSPVKNAVTVVNVPEKGKYRLWVRTRDWAPGHNDAGNFSVIVDGAGHKFRYGMDGNTEWHWERGPVFSLNRKAKIEIKDRVGYYGRCDALVLTSDMNWAPPSDIEAMDSMRVDLGILSAEREYNDYDVIVIGGGLSGCMAAVSAARQGAKTALIQNRPELGGNASTENLVPPVGSLSRMMTPEEVKYFPRETGLIEEVALPYGPQSYMITNKNWPYVLERLVKSEPNLDLYLNTHAFGVRMVDDRTIEAVRTVEIPSGKRSLFRGKIFIDCTGNGIIALKAGANYMYGREGQDDYDEAGAPMVGNSGVMPASLKYWYEPTDRKVEFTPPSWIIEYKECDKYIEPEKHLRRRYLDAQWIIELGGADSVFVNGEKVRDELLKLVYGIWDHQRNHCKEFKHIAEKHKLVWVGHILGYRESYRIKGDYVMSEKDVELQPKQDDRVAFGAWGLDDHPSRGFIENTRVNRKVNHSKQGLFFSIPYRSLYSDNISNLLLGGRNISVTHRALSAVRLMYTLSIVGQASGTAAGMCISYGTTPRGIYESYMPMLQQQLMKDGAYIIELPNRDPNDLALLTSTIVSSSNQVCANKVVNGYSRARLTPLFPYKTETETNAWIPDKSDIQNPWIELGWTETQRFNVIHISFLTCNLAASEVKIEYLENGFWKKATTVQNTKFRRLVIPVGDIATNKIRVTAKNLPEFGGICEIRVYNEPQKIVEQIKRANYTMNLPEDPIVYPWMKR